MALRSWSSISIVESGDPLLPLPAELLCLEPHPYVAVGAPYGSCGSPFRLRGAVITRLLQAQSQLEARSPGWRLAIFDAWRPLEVQRFMVQYAIAEECTSRGIDPEQLTPERDAVVAEVGRFWAPPSADLATPPPHSTGAAVDLTLVDGHGHAVAMGSPIDAIGAVSEPDHFLRLAESLPEGDVRRDEALSWHRHRALLAEVMAAAGFIRHPNEWWHFSWGDQLWAWRSEVGQACYGRWLGA